MKRLITSFCFCISALVASAQNYQLHSVFMYSFARYIQWPDEGVHNDFHIMVLGESPIVGELQNLAAKKKIGDRSIRITQIHGVADVKKCNILFVSASQSAQLPDILVKLADESTLVVTEQAGLGVKGSNINFIQKDGKLAFELNAAAMTRRKLKPSTELTRIAILI